MYCNVMVALGDFTEANGATRIVVASNHLPHDPVPIRAVARGEMEADYETIPAVMARGSVCFVLGSTYHGGGENRTDAPRHGMTMAYCGGWVRPQENFLVAVSQERAATFDPELQGLMGYSKGRGDRLGHIYTRPEDLSGPLAHRLVLEDATPTNL
jgi:ectoine hydroxylase-related dioxygenase (phytanoyl-CoA dioxygenase family)